MKYPFCPTCGKQLKKKFEAGDSNPIVLRSVFGTNYYEYGDAFSKETGEPLYVVKYVCPTESRFLFWTYPHYEKVVGRNKTLKQAQKL